LEAAKNNENHLARKTIDLYNTNQKLEVQIAKLTKQIEDLNTPVEKSQDPDIHLTSEGKTHIDKIRPEAALQYLYLLKKDLKEFNDKPFYQKLVEAPKFLEGIAINVNGIAQDINTAPQHTPNTSSLK
jgi:hypothetical protein